MKILASCFVVLFFAACRQETAPPPQETEAFQVVSESIKVLVDSDVQDQVVPVEMEHGAPRYKFLVLYHERGFNRAMLPYDALSWQPLYQELTVPLAAHGISVKGEITS